MAKTCVYCHTDRDGYTQNLPREGIGKRKISLRGTSDMEGKYMKEIDYKAYIRVKACRACLSKQQYKTIMGQVFAGDGNGALKGLRKILREG